MEPGLEASVREFAARQHAEAMAATRIVGVLVDPYCDAFVQGVELLLKTRCNLEPRAAARSIAAQDLYIAQACALDLPDAWERLRALLVERTAETDARDQVRDLLDVLGALRPDADQSTCSSALSQYNGAVPLHQFLKRVLWRNVQDEHRCDHSHHKRAAAAPVKVPTEPQPLDALVASEIAGQFEDALVIALDGLPPHTTRMLYRRILDGCSLLELAPDLGCSESGASHAYKRAVERLGKTLRAWAHDVTALGAANHHLLRAAVARAFERARR
jgi:DNA-directed RNA polymerase specialized sigma24 family protein